MLVLKGRQALLRVAENTFCLRLANRDLFVVGVDLQHVAGINVQMAADILGNNNSPCLVDFTEIGVDHQITSVLSFLHILQLLQLLLLFYHISF